MNLVNHIASGNTANIYLHDNRVVKVFHDHFPDGEAVYEANKQMLAHSYGLPVPEILNVTEIDGKQAIVMEYVKGKTLGELALSDSEKAGYFMSLSVDIQLQIHSMTAPCLEPMSGKLTRQIETAKGLEPRKKVALLEKLASMWSDNRLCHGDFHLYNLIHSDGRIMILDWTDSSSGDIRADVYRSYLLYSQVSSDLAELYMRLYCLKSGISEEEVLEWAPIIAGARLSEHVSSENNMRLINIVNQYFP
ncbi:phosphotransferase family protein [Rossellomorea sp. NS-SX7]|uniref:phosphotransferase family protein n=1 Tax=Rossellomorea sp. NS-SX7 TaxID=3463856 RepID=UPI0040596E64